MNINLLYVPTASFHATKVFHTIEVDRVSPIAGLRSVSRSHVIQEVLRRVRARLGFAS